MDLSPDDIEIDTPGDPDAYLVNGFQVDEGVAQNLLSSDPPIPITTVVFRVRTMASATDTRELKLTMDGPTKAALARALGYPDATAAPTSEGGGR